MPIIDGQRGVYNPLRFVQADSCSKRTHQNSGSRGATMKRKSTPYLLFYLHGAGHSDVLTTLIEGHSGPLAGVNDVPRRLIQTLR